MHAQKPSPQELRGSIKPIFSKNFRDTLQVDLIDFCRLRKRDPFGVLMRWVMTLKDHATGLTFICALPRKQAHLVAYKLQEIFGLIGFSEIHTHHHSMTVSVYGFIPLIFVLYSIFSHVNSNIFMYIRSYTTPDSYIRILEKKYRIYDLTKFSYSILDPYIRI